MGDHRRLRVWLRARALSVLVYRATIQLDQIHGVRHYQAQLRRAVSSIAANIAEGRAQESQAQFARYLSNSIGSAGEALSHLDEMRELRLISVVDAETIAEQLEHTRAMLIRLRQRIRKV